MVCNYKSKGIYMKWDEEDMEKAINSVLNSDLSLRGAAGIFNIPVSTLKDQCAIARKHKALGEKVVFRHTGHPTVFSAAQENALVDRLKYLANREFGCTAEEVRRAAFVFANENGLKHPWDKLAGEDWFTSFMKRHRDLSL